jgi:hypothetical protein
MPVVGRSWCTDLGRRALAGTWLAAGGARQQPAINGDCSFRVHILSVAIGWACSSTRPPTFAPREIGGLPFEQASRARRRPRRGSRCSTSSRASTTGATVIRRSGISRRSTTSVFMRPIPTHTSLPPCSRPSRASPPGDSIGDGVASASYYPRSPSKMETRPIFRASAICEGPMPFARNCPAPRGEPYGL